MGDEWDEEQDGRLDDLEDSDADQDGRLDDLEEGAELRDEADEEQDARLDAVEHSTEGVDAELPGINTPEGAQQRLKLSVPTPLTLVTLGAIGNNDAGQHPVGPAGFALKTVENFAAEVQVDTILDTDRHIIVHTPEDLTGVTGKKLNFSTNGDYKLGTVGGVSITAAPGAGFTDPAFTVDPQMAVPAPPAIDTKGPTSTTDGVKTAWGAIWKAYDAYSGFNSLKDMIKQRSLAKGIAKDTFHGNTAGLYSIYSNLKKLYDAGALAYDGAVAAFDHFWPSEKPDGPGKPKVTMYAEDGITMLTPAKVSIFSTTGGISVESPHKVGVKAGISASMKAGCDAAVFAFVSAKLESKGIAAVKGKIVSVSADLTEVIGKKGVVISSDSKVAVESEGSARLTAKEKLQVAAPELWINSDKNVMIACDETITQGAKTSILSGKEKVFIWSETEIKVEVKKTGFSCTDGEFKFGCDDKVGVKATSSQCNVGTQKSYAIYKDSGFQINGGGASKIKAPNISIG
ncbi:MAG: hypothetical protein R3B82_28605 [Sandaracinaceae bacterium]